MDPVNVPAKFEIRSFTRSWDNRGYSTTLGSPWICPCSLFSKIFNGLLCRWTMWMYQPNLQSIALPDPEIIVIEVLAGGCKPQSWRREGRRGSGMVPFERALVSSYRPYIATFTLSLRVSEILPLLCSSTPLFPTPPLVSPNFLMFPLGLGDGLWATKSEGVGLIVRAINFQDFEPMWSWSTNVNDRRHVIAVLALCTALHHAVVFFQVKQHVDEVHLYQSALPVPMCTMALIWLLQT